MTEPHTDPKTRQQTTIDWTVAHAGELTLIGLPLVGGLIWTGWLDIASALAAGLWAVHEIRLRRTTRNARAAVTSGPARPQLTTAAAGADTTDDRRDRREAKA